MSKNISYVWLVFHYETEKLSNLTGREDDKINSNADVVFKYTTASIKTFLANNPEKEQSIKIFTDDVDLIKENINKYIGSKSITIVDIGDKINKWKVNSYPWYPKTAFLKDIKKFVEGSIMFIDNDCICKKSVDELDKLILGQKSIIFWEPEREITNTRPYWGWQKATRHLNRPFNYWVYNDGIIGVHEKEINSNIFSDSHDICMDVWENVDIKDIPGRPADYPPEKVFIAQQIAICFAGQDRKLELIESKEYFDHLYSNKMKCLDYL